MAGYGTTTQRLSSTAPPPSDSQEESSNSKATLHTFSFSFTFNLPSTPASAAARFLTNVGRFGLYYTVFVWTVLFITLIPARKVSIVCLVATSEIGYLYSLLMHALPASFSLHKIIDRRVVMTLLVLAVVVEMILTNAGTHLAFTVAATGPLVVLHAILSKTEGLVLTHEAAPEELAHLV